MSRRSDDDYFTFDKLHKQLEDSIEQSKEMTRRSQALLDRQRSGQDEAPGGGEQDGGKAA